MNSLKFRKLMYALATLAWEGKWLVNTKDVKEFFRQGRPYSKFLLTEYLNDEKYR